MAERKFKRVESSSTWDYKIKQDGDQLEGILISKIPYNEEKKVSARYYIENQEGRFMIWGAASLDDKMSGVEIGDYVRITYEGKKDIGKNKTLHTFVVEIEDKSENSEAEKESEFVPTEEPKTDSFFKKPDVKPTEELVK